jgi:hypothetical protein
LSRATIRHAAFALITAADRRLRGDRTKSASGIRRTALAGLSMSGVRGRAEVTGTGLKRRF